MNSLDAYAFQYGTIPKASGDGTTRVRHIKFTFTKPIQLNRRELYLINPKIATYNGKEKISGDFMAAADLLDDFVVSAKDLDVAYDPTPEHNSPRMILSSPSTPLKLVVY